MPRSVKPKWSWTGAFIEGGNLPSDELAKQASKLAKAGKTHLLSDSQFTAVRQLFPFPASLTPNLRSDLDAVREFLREADVFKQHCPTRPQRNAAIAILAEHLEKFLSAVKETWLPDWNLVGCCSTDDRSPFGLFAVLPERLKCFATEVQDYAPNFVDDVSSAARARQLERMAAAAEFCCGYYSDSRLLHRSPAIPC